jgi:tRNA U38,U39,U40 pseudouridine synthase TruA
MQLPIQAQTWVCLLAAPAQVQGTGFLYKQVRHMTGTLLAVGQGKLTLDRLQQLLDMGNSQPPGMPPAALCRPLVSHV